MERRIGRAFAALALCAAAGCGLGEYERRIDEQRARLREFDEVSRLLDDPIDPPPWYNSAAKDAAPDGQAWPFEIYLRLPKGYGVHAKDKGNYFLDFPCYRYTGGAEGAKGILIAAVQSTDPKKAEEGKYPPEKFKQYLRLAIEEYNRKHFRNRSIETSRDKYVTYRYPPFSAYPKDSKPLAFDWIEYRDNPFDGGAGSAFDVYIHERDDKLVGVIVHRPTGSGNLDHIHKAVKASLSTLDISADAGKRRTQFKKRR